MTLALKQGFGRLIRRNSDKGVVAILDERLTSKGYGRQARRDLPAARFSREFKDVHRFFQEALDTRAEFALNVWGWATNGRGVHWRWQLMRLQDGKADVQAGSSITLADPVQAEIYAARLALEELQQRIQRAGRSPADFVVELRPSAAAGSLLTNAPQDEPWGKEWTKAAAPWQRVVIRPVG